MMYCLRSYIPLLLLPLPLSLSPIHLTLLLTLTYLLNRPCIYCSLLLLILFASSCHWSNRCFVDFSYKPVEEGGFGMAAWWMPRLYTTPLAEDESLKVNRTDLDVQFWTDIVNSTVAGVANAVFQDVKNRIAGSGPSNASWIQTSGAGIGSGWIKSLLGKSEWTLPCTQWKIAV